MPTDVKSLIHEGAELTDRALEELIPSVDTVPSSIHGAMRHSTFAGGKRLRPVLAMQAAVTIAGTLPAGIARLGAALEMLHTYSLIHDDLPALDNDDVRRGRPTVHKAFDEATAILAGDALLTFAFELLAREITDPVSAAACVLELSKAAGAAGMVGGQADDLDGLDDAEHRDDATARLEGIHARKTGALFLASVRMGAIAARADERARRTVDEYGRRIGLVFQIVDDILDLEQDGQAPTQADFAAAAPSFPELLGLKESQTYAERLAAEACGAVEPLGPSAERLRELAHFIVQRTE